ncbi:uncharacterized protein LOC121384532 [Gigantopelta aegis]|uniref:uncharacterized protein LOC121384532 n=1 Tax=Gigantopelta aegis TaxID=1735272 RepID=UPI001B88CD0B|nr:uncharacterized protein LOC121384532 [Gigantopelta aegis]
MSDLVNELYIRSQEGHILSGNLKNHFFVHRIDSSLDIAQYLEKVHLNGQPLPGHVMDWNNKNETGDVLITDFINLSTVLVFLEQILVDDLEHENSSSQTEMKTLENKLFSILCQTETILQTLGLKVPSHVTRDVMDNALRDVKNTADRRKRDYTMAKDAVHLMKANEDNHIKMKAAYN